MSVIFNQVLNMYIYMNNQTAYVQFKTTSKKCNSRYVLLYLLLFFRLSNRNISEP